MNDYSCPIKTYMVALVNALMAITGEWFNPCLSEKRRPFDIDSNADEFSSIKKELVDDIVSVVDELLDETKNQQSVVSGLWSK